MPPGGDQLICADDWTHRGLPLGERLFAAARGWAGGIQFNTHENPMGEAKRRREKLGDLYGTPEGSNRKLIVYQGYSQEKTNRKVLQQIKSAEADGLPVILVGNEHSRHLAKDAGLAWLHELNADQPIPESFAWDIDIAARGGPMLPIETPKNALLILGDGFADSIESMLLP